MKIAVFGANGGIGRWVVKYALERDYDVIACVRRMPSKPLGASDKLRVVVVNTEDKEKMEGILRDSHAVINCIGVSMRPFHEDKAAVHANSDIISAMKAAGVNRYITWATPSIRSDEDRRSVITVVPGIMASIFLPKAKKCIRQIISDVVDSDLQWTVVRFMAPKDTAPSGKVKVSFGQRKIRFNISRADIASFMVSQVGSKEYIGRMPIIGY